mmetsp:Transcript_25529/g.82260  ORF Transcript_25529/g.82260 Transcript_25529/m.82260 type:complete len:319 (-) Transcript_25529:52-1008(-)
MAWPARTGLALLLSLAVVAAEDCDASRTEGEDFSDAQLRTLKRITLSSAILSMMGSSFIIFSYFYFVQLRTLAYRMIVFLSVADFFSSISYVIGAIASTKDRCPDGWCYLTAVMSQYFDVATFLWTACIAFNIHQVLVKNVGHAVEGYQKFYHMLCWGLPAVLAGIAGIANVYGDSGNWCWIRHDRQWARLTFFYAPLVIVFCYNAMVFYFTVRAVRHSLQQSAIAFRLRLYILVFFMVKVFSVINRLQNAVDPNNPVLFLYIMQSFFEPLQGLGNALVYGLNKMVITQYRLRFRNSVFCRCCKTEGSLAEHQMSSTI